MFENKNILITGATGSFGKSFIAYILKNYKPNKIIVYSRDEFKQYELSLLYNNSIMRYFIGDVRDFQRLNEAMNEVDIVIHAAALKQVPTAEYNPDECIKTNINGAMNLIKASLNNNVDKVIALSTDKAVNPLNLYGATKLASDKLFIAANNKVGKKRTKFSVVRYGNVIGSRGSVIPLFKKLIKEGKKTLPITDLKMTRFFIKLEEGVEFVSKSFSRMQGGEIFVPKLPSIKITDIAFALDKDISFDIIGIRPGEKLHEVMCPVDYSGLTLEFKDYFLIKPPLKFTHMDIDYSKNSLNEKAIKPKIGEEYNSLDNDIYLNTEQLKNIL